MTRSPFSWLLLSYVPAVIFLVLGLAGVHLPQPWPYAWHKLLHIFGVVLFLGNAIVVGLWMSLALHSHKPELIRFAITTLCWADVCFTGPGFLLTVANGVILSQSLAGLYALPWLRHALLLLALMGLLGMIVMPLQIRMWRLCRTMETEIPPQLPKLIRQWNLWGALILLPLLAVLALMVIKPG
ncbi:MAG: DUF2269 family protein [Candidatus Sericytochromatia bacterium]